MNEEREYLYEETPEAVVRRYEDMIRRNQPCYFDVHEYEDIIDFYLENNQVDNAGKAIQAAFAQHPESTSIQLRKAQVLIDEGKPFQALKLLHTIEQYEPENEDIYLVKAFASIQLGNIKEAVRQYDIAIGLCEDDKIDLLHNIGITFLNSMHFKLAIKYLKMAHEMQPDDHTIIFDLAFAYERNNDFKKSIVFFNKYLDYNAYSELVWYKLGMVYHKMENFDKAVESFNYALAIDDTYALVYLSKGNSLMEQGKYTEAIAAYNDFLELEHDYIIAYCSIGYCYEQLGQPEEALDYYKQAIEIDDELPEPWYSIGILKIEQGKFNESLFYLNKAVELDDQNDEYWATIAEVSVNIGSLNNGLYAYLKAIETDPFNFHYWVNCAQLYIDMNYPDRAVKLLEGAIEYHSDIIDIYYYLAAASFFNGNMDESLRYMEKALKENYNAHYLFLMKFPELESSPAISKLIKKYK